MLGIHYMYLYLFTGDGVIDQDEYANFYYQVCGLSKPSSPTLQKYFDVLTEVGCFVC